MFSHNEVEEALDLPDTEYHCPTMSIHGHSVVGGEGTGRREEEG